MSMKSQMDCVYLSQASYHWLPCQRFLRSYQNYLHIAPYYIKENNRSPKNWPNSLWNRFSKDCRNMSADLHRDLKALSGPIIFPKKKAIAKPSSKLRKI